MQPWTPGHLPPENIDYAALAEPMAAASGALGRLDGLLIHMTNPQLLLGPLRRREVVLSSRIEGTQATVEDMLEFGADPAYIETGKRDDVEEVANYEVALNFATDMAADRPLTLGLILDTHRELMRGVRGENKNPGKIRKGQNLIGTPGDTTASATFVPPVPAVIEAFMVEWQEYISKPIGDPLVQAAIMHAQFECLHPFDDGNGRMGRLLIPLLLHKRGALSTPSFYLSDYLEQHRTEYYARLLSVSQDADWTGWIAFFLRAATAQAINNVERAKRLMKLHEATRLIVSEITASRHSFTLTEVMFRHPFFRISDVQAAGIPKAGAHAMVKRLEQERIVRVRHEAAGPKGALYYFVELAAVIRS